MIKVKTTYKFFEFSLRQNFLKQVFLFALIFVTASLIPFLFFEFLITNEFNFLKILGVLIFFWFFLTTLESFLIKRKKVLALLSLIETISFFWLLFFELKPLFYFSDFKELFLKLSLGILIFLLNFLAKIKAKNAEKSLLHFSFSQIASFNILYSSLALIIVFLIILNFYPFFQLNFLDFLFKFFKLNFKSSLPLKDLIFKVSFFKIQKKNLQKNWPQLEKYLAFNFSLPSDYFHLPFSIVLAKVLWEKFPFKIFCFFELSIFFLLLTFLLLVGFLTKIFGWLLVEFLIAINFLKRNLETTTKESISFFKD